MADICQSNTLQQLWTLILGAFCLFNFSFSLYFELNIKKNVECQILTIKKTVMHGFPNTMKPVWTEPWVK
jgi:hypothetical protein